MRPGDTELLRGMATFAADVRLPGLAHAAVLRSPIPHGRIVKIDITPTQCRQGVLAVVTHADLGRAGNPIPQRMPHAALTSRTPPPLAYDVVRYVGEPVAVVVASDRHLAEDALESIDVVYQPLQAATHAEGALQPEAALVHADLASNLAARFGQEVGNANQALAGAHLVVRDRLSLGRSSAQPIECRTITAWYRPELEVDALTVWCGAQSPHGHRRELSELLGLPLHQVRVIATHIGGGFGTKNRFYPEDLLVPLLAMQLGRPIIWTEQRTESLVSTYQSREQLHEVALALDAEGRILALEDQFLFDQGAYSPLGIVVPYVTSVALPGPYRVPNYRVQCEVVYTNKTPTAPYRGAGKPEATFVMERMLDLAADDLGLDRVDIRRRNLVRGPFPYDTGMIDFDGTKIIYDSADHIACLDKVLSMVNRDGFGQMQDAARVHGRCIGMGVACYVEMSGRGPFETAQVSVTPAGRAEVRCGVSSQGQSHQTVLGQICAQGLGFPREQVTVILGDTSGTPLGIGTYAARVTVMAGNAVAIAAATVRRNALASAAKMLGLPVEDLEIIRSGVRAKAGGRLIGWADMGSELCAVETFQSSQPVYANGVYAVVVEVDAATGLVKVIDHALAHDCGRIVDRVTAEGQLMGGLAQGLGGALMEEVVYDEEGRFLNYGLAGYLLPTACDVPNAKLAHVETPSPFNPLGVKGVGEAGTIPVAPAVCAAIEDALGRSIRLRHVPIAPEDLYCLVRDAADAATGGASTSGVSDAPGR